MTAAVALPPEFMLTVACCRWPSSEARDAAVRLAAADLSNWDRLLPVVRRHRVEGLAYAALSAAGIEPPSAVAQVLARRAHGIARHNLMLAAETARLQGLFDAAGIPVLVLKGVPLALLAYKSLGQKHSKDIDLLVPPDRAMQAWDLLEAQGYCLRHPRGPLNERQRRLVLRYAREIALADPDSGSEVELRWRAATSPPLLAGVDAHSPYQMVTLPNGAGLRTLKDDDLFAYLCLHGADHGWSRLKWLADLNGFLAGRDNAEALRLLRHAETIGAGVCAGLALTLRHRLFGGAPPFGNAVVSCSGARLRILTALAADIMVGPAAEVELEDRRFGSTRVALIRFLLGGGWANVVALGRDLSIRLDDVVRLPLPDMLHFLYLLLRLPLWLWRRIFAAGRRSKA